MPKLPQLNEQSRLKFFGTQRLGASTQGTIGRGLEQLGGALGTFAQQMEKADNAERRVEIGKGSAELQKNYDMIANEIASRGGDGKEDLAMFERAQKDFFDTSMKERYSGRVLKELEVRNEQIANSFRPQVMVNSRKKQNAHIKQTLDNTISSHVENIFSNPDSYATSIVEMTSAMRETLEALDMPDERIEQEINKQIEAAQRTRMDGYADRGEFDDARKVLKGLTLTGEERVKLDDKIDKEEERFEIKEIERRNRAEKESKKRITDMQEKNFINLSTQMNLADDFAQRDALWKSVEKTYKGGGLSAKQFHALGKTDSKTTIDLNHSAVFDIHDGIFNGDDTSKLYDKIMDKMANGKVSKAVGIKLVQTLNKLNKASSKTDSMKARHSLRWLRMKVINKDDIETVINPDQSNIAAEEAAKYAIDLKEKSPSMSWDDAAKIAADEYLSHKGARSQYLVRGYNPSKQNKEEDLDEILKDNHERVKLGIRSKEKGLEIARAALARKDALINKKEVAEIKAKNEEYSRVVNEVNSEFDSYFQNEIPLAPADEPVTPFR